MYLTVGERWRGGWIGGWVGRQVGGYKRTGMCVCVCVCRYVSAWMGRKMGGYVYSWVGGGWREMDRGIGWVVG